ncbi:MAG: 50S ribosomal protein L21 [Candidatus Amoebophilus sp. 36-38]|nr:MAG: 50S ribosomal protein L21 [Candidatus Amoebophilus sp. 36-38]
MYAIAEIAGKQFRLTRDQYIYTPKMEQEVGSAVLFDKILLLQDGEKIHIGSPIVSGAKAEGKVLEHVKGDKIIVFKRKRRKGYKVKKGHRQGYTKVLIENILK